MSYEVFDYLRNRGSLNKFVFTSASSKLNESIGDVGPHNVLDTNNSTMYHSDCGAYQDFSYLRIDFPISPIFIEKFYLLTAKNRDPYNWVLEGSNNTVDFIILYNNTNTRICEWGLFDDRNMGCMNITKFERDIPSELQGYYTSIRFRQTNFSSSNDKCLPINQIEFIGHINAYALTCLKKSFTFNTRLFVTLFALPILLKPQ